MDSLYEVLEKSGKDWQGAIKSAWYEACASVPKEVLIEALTNNRIVEGELLPETCM